MSKLDDLIREALEGSDREALRETEELGYFQLGLSQFTGKLGWVTWVIMVVQTIMFVISLWCAIQFFNATEVLPAIKWGISGAVLMLMALTIKVSLMPQMQADRVIREVRRLELLITSRDQ
jgi:hypothetical protein